MKFQSSLAPSEKCCSKMKKKPCSINVFKSLLHGDSKTRKPGFRVPDSIINSGGTGTRNLPKNELKAS